jgi:hypothetical protein
LPYRSELEAKLYKSFKEVYSVSKNRAKNEIKNQGKLELEDNKPKNKLDLGFKVFKLDRSNFIAIFNVRSARLNQQVVVLCERIFYSTKPGLIHDVDVYLGVIGND